MKEGANREEVMQTEKDEDSEEDGERKDLKKEKKNMNKM